jgi:hypothetical protein
MNWDSIEELKLMRAKIDRRLNQLQRPLRKEKSSHTDVFNACNRILETDISDLYCDVKTCEDSKFYVYVHCNPLFALRANANGKIAFAATLGITHLPFYVGKGSGDRAYDINRNGSHRKIKQVIHESGKSINVRLVKSDLTEVEALMLEAKLIDIFGLKSYGGWLVNLDEGVKNTERHLLYNSDLQHVNKFLKSTNKPVDNRKKISV